MALLFVAVHATKQPEIYWIFSDNIKSRLKTDEDGYANDTADDDEPPLFRKQRGVTRVAFNLEPVCHVDMSSDEEYPENGNMEIDVPAITKDQNSNDKL